VRIAQLTANNNYAICRVRNAHLTALSVGCALRTLPAQLTANNNYAICRVRNAHLTALSVGCALRTLPRYL